MIIEGLFITLIVGTMLTAARKVRKNQLLWGFIGLAAYLVPAIVLTIPLATLLYQFNDNNSVVIVAAVITKIIGILIAFALYRIYLVPKNAAGKKMPWYMQ